MLHLHMRKRVHLNKSPFPHPDRRVRIVDTMAMINSVAMPLTTLPQILKIYIDHAVEGLSIVMWVLYSVSCCVMMAYAVVHKARELIILNILWMLASLIIIAGIVIYS